MISCFITCIVTYLVSPTCMTHFFICISLNFSCIASHHHLCYVNECCACLIFGLSLFIVLPLGYFLYWPFSVTTLIFPVLLSLCLLLQSVHFLILLYSSSFHFLCFLLTNYKGCTSQQTIFTLTLISPFPHKFQSKNLYHMIQILMLYTRTWFRSIKSEKIIIGSFRIREIGPLIIHTRYLTFSFKKICST